MNIYDLFYIACQSNNIKYAKNILENNIDMNHIYNYGNNAFTLACRYGLIEIIEILLKKNININHLNNDQNNGFFLVCFYNYNNIIEFLLNTKINIHYINKYGSVLYLVYFSKYIFHFYHVVLKF